MKISACLLLSLLAPTLGAAPLLQVAGADKKEWVALFDGKSLDGWTPKIKGYEVGVNYGDTFRVENGVLKVVYDKDKTKLIHEAIAAGVSQYGMQTFDQSIFQLYKKELITYDEALRRASNPDEFKLKIQGIQSTSDMAAEEMEKTMQSFDME